MRFRKMQRSTKDLPETKLRVRSPKDPKGAYISITLTGGLLKLDILHELNNREFDPYPTIDSDAPFQPNKTELKQCSEWLGDMAINKKLAELLIKYLTPQTNHPGWLAKVRRIHEILKSNAVFAFLAFRLGMANHPTDKSSANTLEEYYHHLELTQPNVCDKWIRSVFRPLIEWIKVHHFNQQRTFDEFMRSRHPEQLLSKLPKPEPGTLWLGATGLGARFRTEADSLKASSSGAHFVEDEDGMLVLQDDESSGDDDETGTDDSTASRHVRPVTTNARVTRQLFVDQSSGVNLPSEGGVEYKKMEGRVLDLSGKHILTLLHGPNSTRTVKVLPDACEAVEKFKYRNGTLKLSWKALGSTNLCQPSLNDVSDDEDDDIEVLNVVSKLTVGMDILIWVPFKNGTELKGIEDLWPFVLAHPWDTAEVRGPALAR